MTTHSVEPAPSYGMPARQGPHRFWIGLTAAILVGTGLAIAIAVLMTGGDSDESVTTGRPAPVTAVETAPVGVQMAAAQPYASSVAVWNDFLAGQEAAALPYANSVAVWEDFLTAQEVAALPYASSVAVWNDFLAAGEAPVVTPEIAVGAEPYASSVAVWEDFLAAQEIAELPYASSVAVWNDFLAGQDG